MSTLTMPLPAGIVTFEILDQLQEHAPISWGAMTAPAGQSYSPLQGDAWPDYTVFPDRSSADHVLVIDYWDPGSRGNRGHLVRMPHRTLGAVLDQLQQTDPICRFRASPEVDPFDSEGSRDLPALHVWTGPVIDAADVPASSPVPELRGGRVSYRGRLSHRTNLVEDHPSMEPWETLILRQAPSLTEWVLQSGSHIIEDLHVHEHAADLDTLDEVLTWAGQYLHTADDAARQGPVRAFVVSTQGPGQPMTVRVW
jgi:hypothetical protein